MPSIPETIIGHEAHAAHLLEDIARDNIAHAYLFTGPAHVGKRTLARWFAWRLLAGAVPVADRKRLRHEMEHLLHPDYIVLDQLWIADTCEDWAEISHTSNAPQLHRSKAKNSPKSDTIGIDDIRALTHALHQSSTLPRRCCVIHRAERMNAEASNALLKTLEEPPERVTILLTAESESALLPTIVSRARRIRLSPVPADQMRPLLAEMGDDATFLLALAQGCPGMLLRFIEDPDLLRNHRTLHGEAKRFWTSSPLDRQRWILGFAEKGTRVPSELLVHLSLALRETNDHARIIRGARALETLHHDLDTHVSRPLILQRFALAV